MLIPLLQFRYQVQKVLLLVCLLCFTLSVQAASINSIKNTAKTQDQEAWEIGYTSYLKSKPTITLDNKSHRLTISLGNNSLDRKALPYQFRVASSIVSKIEYAQDNKSIIFHLNDTVEAKLLNESNKKALKLIIGYNANMNIIPVRVAIDAGHGGIDSGAIGRYLKIYEKDIVFDIAKRLKSFLDSDPYFVPIMTRTGDYKIPVSDRPVVAQKQKAQIMVSIHADSISSERVIGSSVWVLSQKRATTETGLILEKAEENSAILGGSAKVILNNPKISSELLAIQYSNQQKLSTDLANKILGQVSKIANLVHKKPQYASLGVLRSPTIPSVLVETGFLSNKYEERRLNTSKYRNELATAIYQGLRQYLFEHRALYVKSTLTPVSMRAETTKASYLVAGKSTDNGASTIVGYKPYKVVKGDSLTKIAEKFEISYSSLLAANNFSNQNIIYTGQVIQIPQEQSAAIPEIFEEVDFSKTTTYIAQNGDSYNRIALRNNISLADLLKANPQVDINKALYVGAKLEIPTVVINNDDNYEYETVTELVDSGQRYKVKRGDKLTLIARQYDIDLESIAEFNKVKPDRIIAGKTLRIPQLVVKKQKVKKEQTTDAPPLVSKLNSNSSSTSNSSTNSDNKPKIEKKDLLYSSDGQVLVDSDIRHKINRGDRLSLIAHKYGLTTKDLADFNKVKPDLIKIGQVLKIPKKVSEASVLAGNTTAPQTPAEIDPNEPALIDSGIVHLVKSGDQLGYLALKYHVGSKDIAEFNHLTSDQIRIGQKLKIPKYSQSEILRREETQNKTLAQDLTPTIEDSNPSLTMTSTSDSQKLLVESGDIYTIANGDSLSVLAEKFHIKMEDLAKFNNIENNKIYIGQKLKIPRYEDAKSIANSTDTGSSFIEYQLKYGDSLFAIALKHKLSLAELAEFNNLDPDKVKARQVIKIPLPNEEKAEPDDSASASNNTQVNYYLYTVKKGDSLSEIAVEHHSTVAQLQELNQLKDETIYSGMTLKVPQKTTIIKIDLQKVQDNHKSETSSKTNLITYTVKKGDSLSEIALKFKTSTTAIQKLNNLTSTSIYIGQKLKIQRNSD